MVGQLNSRKGGPVRIRAFINPIRATVSNTMQPQALFMPFISANISNLIKYHHSQHNNYIIDEGFDIG